MAPWRITAPIGGFPFFALQNARQKTIPGHCRIDARAQKSHRAHGGDKSNNGKHGHACRTKIPDEILHDQMAKGDAGRLISKHHFALFRCEIRHKNPIYKKIQNPDQPATQQHGPRHIALRILKFRRRIHGGIPAAECKCDIKEILHEGPERKGRRTGWAAATSARNCVLRPSRQPRIRLPVLS